MECRIIATEMNRCADDVRLLELNLLSKQKWGGVTIDDLTIFRVDLQFISLRVSQLQWSFVTDSDVAADVNTAQRNRAMTCRSGIISDCRYRPA